MLLNDSSSSVLSVPDIDGHGTRSLSVRCYSDEIGVSDHVSV